MLAQAAEQRGDFAAAEQSLAKIDDPKRALDVQLRRASLLARQGKVGRRASWCARCPSARPRTRAPSCWPRRRCCATSSNGARPTTVLARTSEQYPERRRRALRAVDDGREAGPGRRHGAAAAQGDRAQAGSPACLQRARLLARRSQHPPRRGEDLDPACAGPRTRRAVHHRQPGLGRVPHGPSRRGAAPAAPGLRGAARHRDRARTWARCCGSPASARRPSASGTRRAVATTPTTCCARP